MIVGKFIVDSRNGFKKVFDEKAFNVDIATHCKADVQVYVDVNFNRPHAQVVLFDSPGGLWGMFDWTDTKDIDGLYDKICEVIEFNAKKCIDTNNDEDMKIWNSGNYFD